MKKLLGSALAVAVLTPVLSTTLLVPTAQGAEGAESVRSVASAAAGTCYRRDEIVDTAKGRAVWLPSSLASTWREVSGSKTISWSRGRDIARTRGTSRGVGGSAGVSVPPVEASVAYNREHNFSTTFSTSFSRDHSDTYNFPAQRTRLRWYQLGREFRATKTMYFTNCPPLRRTSVVRVPIGKNSQSTRLIALESWKNRGKVRY